MVLLVLNFEPCKVFEYPHPNHPLGWKGSTGLSFRFVVIILRADWSHSWWNTFWVLHAWHIQVVKHVKHRMCGEPILPYVPNIYQTSIFITLIFNLGKCLLGNMPCTDSMGGPGEALFLPMAPTTMMAHSCTHLYISAVMLRQHWRSCEVVLVVAL